MRGVVRREHLHSCGLESHALSVSDALPKFNGIYGVVSAVWDISRQKPGHRNYKSQGLSSDNNTCYTPSSILQAPQ